MPLTPTPTPVVKAASPTAAGALPGTDKSKVPEAKDRKDTFNPKDHDGFHVMRADNVHLGTYPTEAEAQMFIDGHVTPQDIKASVVEGHDKPVKEGDEA